MENTTLGLVMTTKSGINLFFNEETSHFSSENREEVSKALMSDVDNFQNDARAAVMANNLLTAIAILGWE